MSSSTLLFTIRGGFKGVAGRRGLGARGVATLVALAGVAGMAQAQARQADFNGDGRADLAIGVQEESVAGDTDAGGVAVMYGGAAGLSAAGDQFWTAQSAGVNGAPLALALFGAALAVGDFDGDGFSDLAIGIPQDTVDGVLRAGAVEVLYGSAAGLSSAGDQRWTRATAGVLGEPQQQDGFGQSLHAGDFNGNGRDDLAIGVPLQTFSGEVHLLYGTASGLTAAGDQIFTQDTPGIGDQVEITDSFGATFAVGDFNDDGRDDLAIGAPTEDRAASISGIVHVLFGSPSGLDTDGAQLLEQGLDGLQDSPENGDEFGIALAAGDFDGDGRDDLAIGAEGENVGGDGQAGTVHVVYGTQEGLDTDNDQMWTQDSPEIRDTAEGEDFFGARLTAGDFDNDGRDDLAIAAFAETLGAVTYAGAVNVLYGTGVGLRAAGNQLWHQNSTGILDNAEPSDFFGASLTAGDYDGDGFDDLVVAATRENIGVVNDCGAVNVIYGRATGLHKAGNQLWHQNSPGVLDTAASGEIFGAWLR